MGRQLRSEQVVIAAPVSLAGSAARLWKITRGRAGWAKAGLAALAVLLITVAWVFVLCWYALFGLWLVPYRIIRRGQRKRKMAALRHAELLDRTDR